VPFLIIVTAPALSNLSSVTVRISAGSDVENISIPVSTTAGIFRKTTLLVSRAVAGAGGSTVIPGNGVVDILPVGGVAGLVCPAVTVSYVDTIKIISASVPIP
jgi:hypothetical protein